METKENIASLDTSKWEKIISLFNTTKYVYALCEEEEEELSTNLQPLNEFRAALDHLMRIVAIEKLEVFEDRKAEYEAEKLHSHLRRAFFDICDLLSINYRGKIIDTLEKYSPDCIEKALPDYYSKTRPRLEEMTGIIADLRTSKRISTSDAEDAIEAYLEIIKELKEYYKTVCSAIPSLNEIKGKNFMNKWGFPILVFIVGTILTIIGLLL